MLRFCREIREEGIRGTVSVLKELNIPLPTILAKIQEQYGPSLEMSKKFIDPEGDKDEKERQRDQRQGSDH